MADESTLNIDSIAIEITANADSASAALDKLTASLNALKAATAGGLAQLNSIAKGLEKLSAAMQGFNNVDPNKITGIVNALSTLQGLPQITGVSNLANQVNSLSNVASAINSMPDVTADDVTSAQNMVDALNAMSTAPNLPDFANVATQINRLPNAVNALNNIDTVALEANVDNITQALSGLSSIGGLDISETITALSRLPNALERLSTIDISNLAPQITAITTAIQPLVTQLQSLSPEALNALAALSHFGDGADEAASDTEELRRALRALNFGAVIAVAKKLSQMFGDWIEQSNEYVENLNLFSVAMGKAADEALNFAEKVNDAMGIDTSQWIRNQGTFKSIASGFGMVEDKANLMSQNLTQLGYDLSSFYNIKVEDAMLKLQSGIAGELEPLRRLGFALDVATLQQVAYNHGITQSINTMTQAQKAQIRYIAIMEQSTKAQHDMARTLNLGQPSAMAA